MTETDNQLWYKTVRALVKAGGMPLPANQALADLIKEMLTEEQANFLIKVKKRSSTFEELKARTGLDDKPLKGMLDSLFNVGAMISLPSRSSGQEIYYISPIMPGMLEFEFMRGKSGEKYEKLAHLHEKFFEGIIEGTQKNYDTAVKMFKKFPPIMRTIPVGEKVEPTEEVAMPLQDIAKIIDSVDVIGVGACYCRHEKNLLNEPCQKTKLQKNCFSFGRMATFLIDHGFIEPISKEDALKVMKKAEEDGLVHKVVHSGSDINREIAAICNCCDCCCGNIGMYNKGGFPLVDLTAHRAVVNEVDCVGCGACVDRCNFNAITIVDDKSTIDENLCCGCGVCTITCPNDAIDIAKTDLRKLYLPPKDLR